MSDEKCSNLEERIIEVAKSLFMEKGYSDTSMSEIAEKVGINRPGLHYYFRTKDKMFNAVFGMIVMSVAPKFQNIILQKDLPIATRVEKVIDVYYQMLQKNPYLPLFILREMNRDINFLFNAFRSLDVANFFEGLKTSLQEEMANGKLKQVPLRIVFFTFLTVPFEKESSVQIIKFVGVAGLLAAAILLYSGSDIFNSTQLARLKFQNPCERYMEDTGYQVCNGFIAYHNGGLFGVGLGNSSQKYLYLPEAHTDFIFPILVEELGLIVGILIILGYVYMLYRILKIAKNADSIRNSIICYGTFIYLLMHLLINLMGTLALIPLTGVPLPFLSYGGSFNMNVVAMLFVVQRIAVENKQNAEKRALANMTK